MDTTTLYHFTDRQGLRDIMASGYIGTTESLIGARLGPGFQSCEPSGRGVGPDVVWVTDQDGTASANADSLGHGLGVAMAGSANPFRKTEVRFTLELPVEDVMRWCDFADASPINPRWRRRLEKFPHRSDWWGVVGRPVPFAEWTVVGVGFGHWTPMFAPDTDAVAVPRGEENVQLVPRRLPS